MGIGVHTCYTDKNPWLDQKCHKDFSTSYADSHFDVSTGVYKIRQIKFFGIYKNSCGWFLGGCFVSVYPWKIFKEDWIIASRKCEIRKIGTRQSTGTPKIARFDYQTYQGEQILIRYQVLCNYIENHYGLTAYEFVDKQVLIKNGYVLPKDFEEKVSVSPRE